MVHDRVMFTDKQNKERNTLYILEKKKIKTLFETDYEENALLWGKCDVKAYKT